MTQDRTDQAGAFDARMWCLGAAANSMDPRVAIWPDGTCRLLRRPPHPLNPAALELDGRDAVVHEQAICRVLVGWGELFVVHVPDFQRHYEALRAQANGVRRDMMSEEAGRGN
jgi:hypothetical protein